MIDPERTTVALIACSKSKLDHSTAPLAGLGIGEQLAWLKREIEARRCRECGCTEWDCSQCTRRTGEPCRWVEEDLCSACVEVVAVEAVASEVLV